MAEAFHAAFVRALAGAGSALDPWLEAADAARLAVYRNTVAKGCAEAIRAQFATVETVVGEAWMRDAAGLFARTHQPEVPDLSAYGAAFPDWLAAFAPAADMPWLADLARIDGARTEAVFAADAAPLDPQALAGLGPDDYARQALVLHPAARVLWFEVGVPGLWLALQDGPAEAALAPEPQGLLIVRPKLAVEAFALSAGPCALLAATRRGESLAQAGAAALSAEPGLDLATAFAHLIGAGAFVGLRNR